MMIEKMEKKSYRPLFAREYVTMHEALVTSGEYSVIFTHREDDPEGVWCADFAAGPEGVRWSHGAGDRTCSKNVAEPVLAASLNEKMVSMC